MACCISILDSLVARLGANWEEDGLLVGVVIATFGLMPIDARSSIIMDWILVSWRFDFLDFSLYKDDCLWTSIEEPWGFILSEN